VKLATEIRWQDRTFRIPVERIRLTEELGYDAVVSSEGWGSDGMTPLGYLAAVTTRLTLGTSITQVTARSPAATIMAMQTLNAITGGGRVWLPRHFAPGMLAHALPLLEEGFRRAGSGKSLRGFEIWAHVDAIVDDDVRQAMQPFKEYVAAWAGSQRQQMIWCGQGDVCDKIEELKAAGRWDEAVAAVPDDYIDHAWLVGPLSRIKRRLRPWLESGATGLIVRYGPQVGADQPAENLDFFRVIAEAAR
jgi:alkanesulfonate monooxygenase SsuD/methylene tetrahydromethanopterin reductase-like flavin-dependent oxidoreductase (luciferase family)